MLQFRMFMFSQVPHKRAPYLVVSIRHVIILPKDVFRSVQVCEMFLVKHIEAETK